MKYRLFIVCTFLLTSLLSCKKDEITTDNARISAANYCIRIIKENQDSLLLPLDKLNTIKALFDFNGIDYSKYQFYNFSADNPSGMVTPQYHVRCYRFENGLKILNGSINVHFNQADSILSSFSDVSTGFGTNKFDIDTTPISLDTIPSMYTNDVVQIFVNSINSDPTYEPFVFGSKEDMIKGCFDLELVYYDLNHLYEDTTRNFTKCWKVTPKNKSYPFVLIDDTKSKFVWYNNGIIVN